MLKISTKGPVTIIRSGRSVGPWVPYTVCSFLLGDLLIDTGAPCARDEFLSALEGTKIQTVLLTHRHEDHIGNNAAVMERTGARCFAHPLTLPYLEDPRKLRLRPYQLFVWGTPPPSRALPIEEEIRAGDFRLRAIHTGGHCPDHICFYEPERRWLFTGDLFCGPRLKYFRLDEDYLSTVEALRRLAGLDVDIIFCSLLGAVEDGRAALEEKRDFMENLRDRVLALHEMGMSGARISRKLLGREGSMRAITLGHYAKKNAVRSILTGGPCIAPP